MEQPRQTSYVICATPRSGSTLLCEALRNTRLAGRPDEYFGPMHVERWQRRWRVQDDWAYCQRVRADAAGSNGVWGVKVMRSYWRDFLDHLARAVPAGERSEAQLVAEALDAPKYIWITRRDKVRQAVSWSKFLQGSAWHWEDHEPQRLDGLVYQPEVLRRFIHQTAVHESAWLAFFERSGIEPWVVTYEDLVERYEQTAEAVLGFLGIDFIGPIDWGERKLQRQADAVSEAWVERFLADHADFEALGPRGSGGG